MSLLKVDAGLIGGLFDLVDDLFTSDEERSTAKIKILDIQAQSALGQMAVNAKEAESKSMFVAGWRPFVGWTCAVAFAWQFVLLPVFITLIQTIAYFNGVEVSFGDVFQFDVAELMPILLGMLGLAGARSYEKSKGVNSNKLGS